MSHIRPTKCLRRQTTPRRPLPAILSELGGHLRWLSQSHTLRPERPALLSAPKLSSLGCDRSVDKRHIGKYPHLPFLPFPRRAGQATLQQVCACCVLPDTVLCSSFLQPQTGPAARCRRETSSAVASRLNVRALPRYRRQSQPALPRPERTHPSKTPHPSTPLRSRSFLLVLHWQPT